MNPFKILFQDKHFFAIDKPAGYFVHPPELSPYPVPREKICLYHLRKHFNQDVFPVHRLDAPTSGVLLFAMSRDSARELNRLFADRKMHKTYQAVVRGIVEEEGRIDLPLEIDEGRVLAESTTLYKRLSTIELPFPVGKKYPTARYSWVEVNPVTGRWHQIRRHFDRIAHPLLGDIEHGDSHHNRFFRDHLEIRGLCLKATSIRMQNPWSQEEITIRTEPCEKWDKIEKLFSQQS
ncbi:pseudouridine synthase [Bdellovibrio bacteriovorus]|uniref:tRNA pseudouridine synthase C n=1 Tax=Bdellovibrio bacteriovorus TaxID=959 RepID=A0A150WU52_BDEBC|nr:pseudouridine synthase [Bdellovibrio bacteriovorus]KYG70005.1 pseudouridine synthase [Bdellovibrio bacteriovorus]